MQRLVYGANADVMPTLMLIALYSSRGKWVMQARGKGEKCNAMVVRQYFGKARRFKCAEQCIALTWGCHSLGTPRGEGDASVESKRLNVKVLKVKMLWMCMQ